MRHEERFGSEFVSVEMIFRSCEGHQGDLKKVAAAR